MKINQGGSSSSKTYSIMQLLCHRAIENKWTIDVVAQTWPSLERGPIRDFKELLSDSPLLRAVLVDHTLSKGPFKFKNGSQISFMVAPDMQKAKSGKRDILFINEANGLTFDIANELIMRAKQEVFIDYNPNAQFWVHKEYVGLPTADFIISNFTHNKYIPKNSLDNIMSFKRKWELTGSTSWRNKWRVYGLGLTGVTEGTIFDNVVSCPFFPLAAKHVRYGLDFGFKNNYTALSKIGVYNKAVYLKEIIYEQKLNSFQLADRLELIGISKQSKIIADSANDEAITILQAKGWNVVPAKKGNDSVKAGIELLQSLPLFLTADSANWWTEVDNYKYQQDKDGRWTNNPVDEYSDLWDSARYALTDLFGLRTVKSNRKGRNRSKGRSFKTVHR